MKTGDECCHGGINKTSAKRKLEGLEIGYDICDLFDFISVEAYVSMVEKDPYGSNHITEVP